MRTTKWLCLLAALVSVSVLHAQDISASIAGKVMDPSSAAVPNAKVTITNTDRNQVVRNIITDTEGNYAAPIIPIGTYSIKVEANGFKTERRTGIVLNVADDLKINISLQIGAVTDSVTVEASAAAVELGTSASSTTIEGVQVRELSLATRNYEQLVGLMPGVTSGATDELYIGNSAPSGTAALRPTTGPWTAPTTWIAAAT
jgi:hypothetical protein